MTIKVCELCAVDFTLKRFLLPLIDGMEAKGWSVTSVCSEGTYVGDMRKDGYTITTIPISRSANPIAHLRSIVELVKYFRREKFDVLHVHTPIAGVVGRIAGRIAGVPLVIFTAHGFYFHEGMSFPKRMFHIALEWVLGGLTDFLFTVSEEDAVTAAKLKIMPVDRVMAIGNGVNMERFNPDAVVNAIDARAALSIPDDAFVIGFIGRMVREKGIVELLQAAEKIARQHSHVYFLLIGDRLASDHNASIDGYLHGVAGRLGNKLILTGLREDIPQLLAAMDVFCLPSYREGLPVSIIEAMMMAKPIVATNIRGSREEVVEGETGFLVPARDADALALALERCVSDAEMAHEMGMAGRVRAMRLYEEKKNIQMQMNQISALLNKADGDRDIRRRQSSK